MKYSTRIISGALSIGLVLAPHAVNALQTPDNKFWVEAGGGGVFQSRNDVQIPASTGTRFSLSDGAAGPFPAYRVYAGFRFLKNHEIMGLWAPLSIEGQKKFSENISYQGATFGNTQSTDFLYRFNSYRLSYRYLFFNSEKWTFMGGLTGKVRDARIQLQQGSLLAAKDDLGFVPLLHFYVGYHFAAAWTLEFYGDALVSPFGRAEDIALRLAYDFDKNWSVSGGYRTVEGGSKGGGSVYTFAWLHYFEVTVKYTLGN
jgi:hypothetical protein